MKKHFAVLFAALFFVGMLSVAETQETYLSTYINAETVSANVSADDSDIAILVRYVGTSASGKVAVADALGDITFTEGAEGAEAATTTFECPVAGALGGVIDVSDPACNTLGEVVDAINGDGTTGWVAVILDGLRSDASTDALLTIAATQANGVDGLQLKWDTTVAMTVSAALTTQRTMQSYIHERTGSLHVNPFDDYRAIVQKLSELSTYGAGTSVIQIISVKTDYRRGSETATTIWSEASGADGVLKTLDEKPFGFMSKKGEKLLLRVVNSNAMSAVNLKAYGVEWAWK